MDVKIDRSGSIVNNNRATKTLKEYMSKTKLLDAWRLLQEDKPGHTWRKLLKSKGKIITSRLDYVIINEGFEQFINKISVEYGFRSDHSLLKVKIVFNPNTRGPGYWKLNTSLLKDWEYVNKMNKLLDIELAEHFTSFKNKWELVKLAVKGSTIQYASRKQKSNRNKVEVLMKKEKRLENELENPTIFIDMLDQLRLVRHEINEKIKEKTRGASIRAGAQWALYGELPSKYFLNLEKQKAQSKTVHRLRKSDGTITDDHHEILQEIKSFYEKLYTSQIESRV